jgi:segregation and condensation protein B
MSEPETDSPTADGEHEALAGADEGGPPSAPSSNDDSLAAGALSWDDDEDEVGHLDRPGLAGTMALASQDLAGALEALILVSDKPIAAVRLSRLTRQDLGVVKQALVALQNAYRGHGIVLDEIAGGFQFRTSPRFAPFVRHLVQQKPTKLSRAQLEVLAIIAYRQPVTRPEVEEVRGVDSGSALKVLLDRGVIKILGKKDEAGRPMLYGTTTEFLELFGLKGLRDLPTLKEFAELTPESRDIFERRIGEPVPDRGMNLETHYEGEASENTAEDGLDEGEQEPGQDDAREAHDAESSDHARDEAE